MAQRTSGGLQVTLKEFEEVKTAKKQEEYEVWFDERAKFKVQIGGIYMPCIKLTRSKVALRDKTVFSPGAENEVQEMQDTWTLKSKHRILRIYDELSVEDKMSVREYFDLLEKKTDMEKQIRQKEEFPDKILCSFCGKPQEECKKLIAGPANVFICDECIGICGEILEEELEKGNTQH